MRINDAVLGVVLLLVAAYVGWQAVSFPGMPGQDYGPGLVPGILAGGFVIAGVVLIVQGLRSGKVQGLIELGEWARKGGHVLDVFLVIGGLALFILLWDTIGFPIGATLFVGGLIARFRAGKVASSFAIALVACLVVDWGFRHFLLVPLPQGPLMGLYY